MCKRYRQYAQQIGRFKTLAQKRQENPDVDLLIGAVNVWCWDRPGDEVCRELQSLGIDRILWSNRSQPELIERMNEMRVLTSRYDIYQDVMNPENFPKLAWRPFRLDHAKPGPTTLSFEKTAPGPAAGA